MKRKYYMRGLGIGVIVTAILFAVAFPKNKPAMTEEEIIAKAKELGYVKKTEGVTPEDIDKIKENTITQGVTPESTVTPDNTQEPTPTPEATPSPVPTPDAPTPPEQPDAPEAPTRVPTQNPTLTVTPIPKSTATSVPTVSSQVTSSVSFYTVKIERGMTSSKVSRLLETVGAIDSASEFSAYMRKNKLADLINIGTFSIPKDASYEEIGRILTEIR